MADLIKNLPFRPNDFSVDELATKLESVILTKRVPKTHSQKYSFAPSSLGYAENVCARKWYLLFDGSEYEETFDVQGILNMERGIEAHTRLQKLFEDAELLVDKEVEIKLKDPPVFGYIDLLIRWNGEVVVGEIKTTRQEAFLFKKMSMKPSITHLIQILLYMKATGKKKGFLYYENTNDLNYIILPVELTEKNDKIISDVMDWMREVYKAWEDKKLPTRPFKKSSKMCKHCPVRKNCWEDQPDGVIDIKPMEVPII